MTQATYQWAKEPLLRYYAQANRLQRVVHLSTEGISSALVMPLALETLAKHDSTVDPNEHQKRLTEARQTADFAKSELDTGFPVLFSFAAIGLWSLLESAIRSLVVAWIQHDPAAIKSEALTKLRIRLGEYEQLTHSDKYHYIVELLEAEVCSGVRNGVERFEALLKPFNLHGPVPKSLRRDIFEFGQIRNALAHRGGHADRQLMSSCPWLNLTLGKELHIVKEHFVRYHKAGHFYVLILLCRTGEFFHRDVKLERDEIVREYGTD